MNLICIGNISFWNTWLKNSSHTIQLNHTFQKQSWLSQYEIMTAHGVLKLSVPTVKATRKGAYAKVAISYDSNWQIEQWRSIENAYKKSPFFIFYNYKIEPIFKANFTYLYEFNLALFHVLSECLKTGREPIIDKETSIYYTEKEKRTYLEYPQVFDDKQPFQSDLCVLDVLFNLGPEALDYIKQLR